MIKTFAEAEEVLAEALPTYESRPQQQALAKAVETGIAAKRHVVAEAGCGTGKSFGYSIPAILHAVNSKQAKVGVAAKREQVLISTATKALQNQLADGDLPFLKDNLGVDFEFALLKGRSNYICRARFEEPENAELKETILNELGETFFDPEFLGDVESLSTPLTSMDRANITISSDECPGKRECPFGDVCFAEAAKAKAKNADVVVVNHALTFTDMVIREKTAGAVSMLPDYSVIVFDEAHEIEEIAGNVLGSKVTEAGLRNLASTVRNFALKYDINVDTHVNAMAQHTGDLFESFGSLLAAERTTVMRIRQNHLMAAQASWMGLFNALKGAGETIDEKYMGEDKDTIRKQQTMVRRITNMVDKFRSMIGDPFDVTVRWIEKETVTNPRTRKSSDRVALNFAPIDVGSYLRTHMWEREKDGRRDAPTAILASATMSVEGSFAYITERLGLDNYDGIDVGTPFDFKTQAGLYVPTSLPEPTPANRMAWSGQAQIQLAWRPSRRSWATGTRRS
jgi:ATP-dependent DNA helicase DinG